MTAVLDHVHIGCTNVYTTAFDLTKTTEDRSDVKFFRPFHKFHDKVPPVSYLNNLTRAH
jgi:hypothetical protein